MALLHHLFAPLLKRKQDQAVRRLAREVVEQCRAALCDHVSRNAMGMSPAALSGYLRAYATGMVTAELAASELCSTPQLQNRVIREATGQLVQVVLEDVLALRSADESRAVAA